MTTAKTDDPLAYFSICVGSIASEKTSAKINLLRGEDAEVFVSTEMSGVGC